MPARTANTALGPDGKVYRTKRRRGRGKVSPTGPYRAESGNEKIRSKSTPAERRDLESGSGRTARRVRRLEQKDRRTAAKAERDATRATTAVKKATASRPIDTLRRAEAKLAKKPDPKLRESARRLRHALSAEALYKARQATPEGSGGFPDRELSSVAPRAYKKATRAAIKAPSSGGLGEPEDLTTAITLAVPGGGAIGAVGKKVAQKGAATVAKEVGSAAAKKVEASGAKTISRTLNAGSGVRAGGRLAGRGARRVAGKDTTRMAEKAAKAAAARSARRRGAQEAGARSRAASAAVPGLKLGKVSIGGTPAARGHIEALGSKKTYKTTARALPGLITYPVGVAAAGGITAGRAASSAAHAAGVPGARGYSGEEITAPVKGEAEETLAFARQVAKVLTASDSKMVKREVEENLGLMLPIMLGLGSGAAGKKLSKGRVTEAVRRIAERSREKRGKAHGYRDGKAPRALERTGQRKESAKTVAKGRTRLRAELRDRQEGMVKAARGARRKEVVRKGVARNKRGKKVDLEIRDVDVASFLQRHPMKLEDPVAMLAEVKRIKSRLKEPPKGMEPDPAKITTRDVIAHIERRPDVLANPSVIAAVRSYREQGSYARRRKETLAPEHSERARFLTAATTRDIPFPEEMHPRSVRDVVRAAPQRGKLSKDVLLKEARHDRSRARKLKKQAATAEKKAAIMRRELETREKLNKDRLDLGPTKSQLREIKALKAMERRGLIPKERRPVGGHLSLAAPSKKALPVRHDALRDRINKLDQRAVTLREGAAKAEAMAARKHKASSEVDLTLTPEFAGVVQRRLREEGITELPEYQYAGTGRQHGAPVYGSTGTKLAQIAGKSKKRKGTAEEFGLVEEGLGPMIRESIARPVARRESYKTIREVIERNRFEPGGKKEWNARDADELFAGADPVLSKEQWMKVPRQTYKRVYEVLEGKGKGKRIDDQDFELVGQLTAVKKGEAKGSHYMIVRKAAMDELIDQLANTLVAPKIAAVNRGTSYLILATSPAWAAMQVVAEYSQAAVGQSKLLNPAFVRKATAAYKAMDPEKRLEFDSWVGVTQRAIERADELKLDLKAGDMDAAHGALGTLDGTPYGRFIKGIPTSIRRIDQWKGGRIRALATLAKIDKDLNSRTNHFIRGVGGMNREMRSALERMKGRSLKEQAEWVADHPKWSRRYQGYLDDVMGNWSALTKNERVAAQAMIFYPFVRMSLRWTFYAFPKRHPVKAAMLYGLGQQNAQEVKKLLGGDPSYFTQWAMVPVDLGDKQKFIDLARIAPGSNALVEALGGSSEGPKGIAAAKLAQPVAAALGTAIYGVSPLSGKQEGGSGWNAFAQFLSFSPISRVAGEAVIPSGRKKGTGVGELPIVGSFSTERQGALDKLSAKLREYDTPQRLVRQLALPPFPKDVGKERDSALLNRVLKALGDNSSGKRDELAAKVAFGKRANVGMRGVKAALKRKAAMEAEYDIAQAMLNGLFDKYGIPYKREQAVGLERYGAIKYGSSDDSGFGSNLSGTGSSGSFGSNLGGGSESSFGENLK